MACAFLCTLPAFSQTWTPEYSLNVQTVTAVVPSPDGSLVAWTQNKAWTDAEHSEIVSQIWMARADGTHRRQLTQGEKGAGSPAFSPDGKYIYFTSARSGKMNAYRIPVAGGEAEQLTEFKGNLGEYRVSRDGAQLAFTGYEPPPDLEKARKEKRDFRVLDADPENFALYVISTEEPRKQRKVFDAKYHIASFDWSPDGKTIAFEHWPSPVADNWTKADIAEVEVATGNVTPRASTGAAEASPHYSPDGRYLAFEVSSNPARWAGDSRIAILNRASGGTRSLPATFDEQPQIVGWSADSRAIFFNEPKKTRAAFYRIPIDGPPAAIYEPSAGIPSAFTLNTTGTHAGFAFENVKTPPEAFCLTLATGAAAQVSAANTPLAMPPLGETKVISWQGKDGRVIEGLLTYPVNYEPGKKVPLILNIHGGPTGIFTENFIGRSAVYPIASFAARGYAVLRPNPRGSGGYGKEFRFANMNDWGGMDYFDDLAGVDKVIAMGVADPDRLGVMGWSYGGYMTSWMITQTNRFKGASVGAGVTDLWSFNGTADIPGFLPDYFGEDLQNLRKHSAITFVKNVHTPTLVLHGEADVRVPPGQGYEFYNALKREDVTTKMVVYPRTPHGPREPKFVVDIGARNLDWMDKYVR